MFLNNSIILFFITFYFFVKIISAQCFDTRYYIQTQRGTDVPDTYQLCEFILDDDREYFDSIYSANYPNATQILLPGEQYSSTRTLNCHGFAWWYIDNNERVWIGKSQIGSEEIFFEAGDGSYDEVSENVCTKISYSGDHSAIPSITANYYYSKWKYYPLMYHHKDYSPYGTANQFFRRSVDVPEDYATISSAVSAAVYGQTIHVSSGSYSITSNITIPSGVMIQVNLSSTVTINSGVSVSFAGSNAKLIVNGTLNANGVTFTRSGTSGTWGGIQFNNGSGGVVQYSNINYANTGVYFNNTSTPVVTHCNINNSGTYGIHLYNNSSPELSYNVISGGTIGINCYQSNPIISHCTITGQSNCGISCFDSDAYMNLVNKGNNVVRGNNMGIASGYESVVYLSSRNNCVHNNTGYEIRCIFAVVNAENTWWNYTSSPYYRPTDFLLEYTAVVDADPNNLRSDPNGCPSSPLFKEKHESILSEGEILDSDVTDILNYEQNGMLETAIIKYKEKFSEKKTDYVKGFILGRLAKCYLKTGRTDFINYLNQEIKSKVKKENNLYGATLRAENIILTAQQKYDQVLKNLITIKEDYSQNEVFHKTSLYNFGVIYFSQFGDVTKAKEYFTELIKNYPNDLLSEQAKIFLGEERGNSENPNLELVKDGEEVDELSDDFQLLGNYPNPFNPTTEIKFSVPVTSNVKLTIYNIMGQEIKTFESDGVSVGTHSFNWNGRNKNEEQVSSGIYIYRLRAIGSNGEVFEKSAKMMMLK